MFYHGYNMMGNWGFGGTSIIAVFFWALLIILFVLILVKAFKSEDKDKSEETKPLEIIKERYAKGEINKKEYEEMKKELK